MSLHPTLSEECIHFSIKKYFYDGIRDVDGVPIYFSYVYMAPKDSVTGIQEASWIKFHLGGPYLSGNMCEVKVQAYVFSRGAAGISAGRLLAQTKDKLIQYLVNTSPDGNGIRSIPLLDLSGNRHSSMVITFGPPTEEEVADDKTLYRLVPIRLKFATI